jgi:hypothetical protein
VSGTHLILLEIKTSKYSSAAAPNFLKFRNVSSLPPIYCGR